jgi:hypothetical protein
MEAIMVKPRDVADLVLSGKASRAPTDVIAAIMAVNVREYALQIEALPTGDVQIEHQVILNTIEDLRVLDYALPQADQVTADPVWFFENFTEEMEKELTNYAKTRSHDGVTLELFVILEGVMALRELNS